jgi:hypothetical protein
MKTKRNIKQLLISFLALGLICGAATVLAQRQKPRMNPLGPLNHALVAAGAPELSSAQQSDIEALILEFRNSHQRPSRDTDIQNARLAYENAILKGDIADAASQAALLANAQQNAMVQRDTDAAVFAINVIGILNTDSGQAEALIAQTGATAFVRMVLGLVDRPGGPGPRGGHPMSPGVAIP